MTVFRSANWPRVFPNIRAVDQFITNFPTSTDEIRFQQLSRIEKIRRLTAREHLAHFLLAQQDINTTAKQIHQIISSITNLLKGTKDFDPEETIRNANEVVRLSTELNQFSALDKKYYSFVKNYLNHPQC